MRECPRNGAMIATGRLSCLWLVHRPPRDRSMYTPPYRLRVAHQQIFRFMRRSSAFYVRFFSERSAQEGGLFLKAYKSNHFARHRSQLADSKKLRAADSFVAAASDPLVLPGGQRSADHLVLPGTMLLLAHCNSPLGEAALVHATNVPDASALPA